MSSAKCFSKPSKLRHNVLIYGAGEAGMQVVSVLAYHKTMHPVGFVDDDSYLQQQQFQGLSIYPPGEIEALLKKLEVDEILLAIPSASPHRRSEILSQLEYLPVPIRSLPDVSKIVAGKVKVADIMDVDIADLLGRDAVEPDQTLLHANIRDKVVMVTGAGGSIGAELCRQILSLQPQTLILFEHSEYHLYEIDKELKPMAEVGNIPCHAILGTIVNEKHVVRVCQSFAVETIYHAAAYKHVPMVEHNPAMGVRNNILGTWYTAQAALKTQVETFVLVSTDKAVRPTNIMGASKRFSELILQALSQQNDQQHQTRFTMVRFGNVLGSSGSVVPLFREQIRRGGPVTVTHSKITRFFMTIPEASQLVLQAGAMGQGGDVFVLDMGEAVNIYTLAERMIRLSGLSLRNQTEPEGDIEIKITGLRPGEKLYEELLIGDRVMATEHPSIMRAEEVILPLEKVQQYIKHFIDAVDMHNVVLLRETLQKSVKDYAPQCDIQDGLHINSLKNKSKK